MLSPRDARQLLLAKSVLIVKYYVVLWSSPYFGLVLYDTVDMTSEFKIMFCVFRARQLPMEDIAVAALCTVIYWFIHLSWKMEMFRLGPFQSRVSWTHWFWFSKGMSKWQNALGYRPLSIPLVATRLLFGKERQNKEEYKNRPKLPISCCRRCSFEMKSLKVLELKLYFHLYVCSLPNSVMQNVNPVSISWMSYWGLKGGRIWTLS